MMHITLTHDACYSLRQFAVGRWVGIELDEPKGKNDGSVSDVRYFTCPAEHGIFVKETQVGIGMSR